MPDPHFILAGYYFRPLDQNVPVKREPNVTLIVNVQGSGRVAARTCWGPHGKRQEICCYSESQPRRSTLGAMAIALGRAS